MRCEIYFKNKYLVSSHNMRYSRGLETSLVEINKYADMTNEEFLSYYAGLKPELDNGITSPNTYQFQYNPNHKAATNIDWRKKGVVSPVKNQARCGSCWAFATNAVIESHYNIKYNIQGEYIDLSEQKLVECADSTYGNQACQGGLMKYAFDYLVKTRRGIHTEEDYPYVSGNGNNGTECKYNGKNVYGRIKGWVEIKNGDENALTQALELHGPIAVGINAGGDAFQLYSSGIYCPAGALGLISGCSALGVNHAVLLVGKTEDAWIIKNSWGTAWGEDEGYVRICTKFSNMCGIARIASYPILDDVPVGPADLPAY